MSFPNDLKYTKEHEWVRVDGNNATVGITDYAQKELGDIVFVDLPQVNSEVEQNSTFGVVESVKAVSDLYSPISGKVVKVNGELNDAPEHVNKDPYGKGWMIVVEMKDKGELGGLFDASKYQAYVEEEEKSK
ncbi:MAG: glycine cleavage system protein H [Candidatus Schekmanbacteria bacterium RIFCSPHIGHO2_02_FULL_38_11]|uniref:Glycine cleavage system H protein n=1 Tax=Candidatus Schekmanbacteria bacterium RIFCSPLOWO2_12_FULL_38_15 TaxID=1817883 RepID=A0A1F7SFD5_9BACT|nr:MAG: glycine cleavage system protein H [Candidatus Schekmanbacteria bacterium GWA2_38_9]OGL48537.1 MAG: glycine cleavage system protein H [Candidatus Schekmanbacteria bacterium RIFCSPLOWO2_02_FULL_38_14]OGL52516.1 MAG: glycine cleavage system protein H [Candidatus Schekmanbacteria bacterium RIFCSPLOWO2_12_FULL_38_15]OGL55546.1 MAG: glycine cleavage system protein H [Candidatus Schekmanbacteria bacterium RIFCSPHIGHO2_02_FULL_38_11]